MEASMNMADQLHATLEHGSGSNDLRLVIRQAPSEMVIMGSTSAFERIELPCP